MTEDAVRSMDSKGLRRLWIRPFQTLAVAAVATVVLLSGCGDFFNPPVTTTGTGTTTTNSGDYLYVANSNSQLNSVAAIQINSGVFTSPTASPYVLNGGSPTALAITPNNAFLYVASGVANTGIYEYLINSDGSLTAQNSGLPFSVAQSLEPSALVVDPTGQWLIALASPLAGLSGAPTATVFAIDSSSGSLSDPNNVVEQVALDTGAVGQALFNPASSLNTAGSLLFVTLGAPTAGVAHSGGVDVLTFDATTGTLTPYANLQPVGNADIGLAINPAGTFLFVTETGSVTGTSGGTNGVRSLSIGSGGGLTQVGAYQTDLGAGAVLVDATGSYLYVANRTPSTISAFSISTTGTLTSIGTAISSVGGTPVAMVEDNSKTYIGVVCEGGSPDLQLFTFDATTPGQLDPSTTGGLTTGDASPAEAVAIVATH